MDMKKAERIERFVRESFEMYDLDYDAFAEQEVTFKPEDAPEIIIKDGLNMFGVAEVAKVLGVSLDDILNMNEDAISIWYRKYSFFRIYSDFLSQWNWGANFSDKKPPAEEILLKAIFSDEDNIYSDYKRRYDFCDIKQRLIKTLEKINLVLPGTIHPNAEITNLRIRTETLISFPQCDRMVQSFLDMVVRLKELFFKAIHSELDDSEINELNFLASWFDACDVITPSTRITYDNILRYREIYAEENHSDFFEYVKLKWIHFSPWRCKEFLDNLDLAQELVNVFPTAKKIIREFAVDAGKYTCEFIWSDAKPIVFSDEEEQAPFEFNKFIGEENKPISERHKEMTVVYVDKLPEEMEGCEKYIQRLFDAASSAAKGGLKVPHHIFINPATIARMEKRISAKRIGGNS